MLTLFKALMFPQQYSVLASLLRAGETVELESVQRSALACINNVNYLNCWERLKRLGLYSLERKLRERSNLHLEDPAMLGPQSTHESSSLSAQQARKTLVIYYR